MKLCICQYCDHKWKSSEDLTWLERYSMPNKGSDDNCPKCGDKNVIIKDNFNLDTYGDTIKPTKLQ